MADSVSVQRTIAAPPAALYDLVADLPGMGRWSPESTGGTWKPPATSATVGAELAGTNANESRRWSTTSTIVTADRPEEIAWEVTVGPIKVARWSYRFEPTDGGCVVTETWTDRRNPAFRWLAGKVTGVADRRTHNEAGMAETLRRLAVAAEAGSA
jgi:hypothetical protein